MKTPRCSLKSILRLPGFLCSIGSIFTAFLTSLEFKKEIEGSYISEDSHLPNYKLLCYHNWIQLSLLIWSHGSEEPNGKGFRQNEKFLIRKIVLCFILPREPMERSTKILYGLSFSVESKYKPNVFINIEKTESRISVYLLLCKKSEQWCSYVKDIRIKFFKTAKEYYSFSSLVILVVWSTARCAHKNLLWQISEIDIQSVLRKI